MIVRIIHRVRHSVPDVRLRLVANLVNLRFAMFFVEDAFGGLTQRHVLSCTVYVF